MNITWGFEGGARGVTTRNAGGFGANMPTWEAMSIFRMYRWTNHRSVILYMILMTLLSNRDPRLTKTIVEFGTPWLDYVYEPHPDSTRTLKISTNSSVRNNDTRAVANFASFTGFVWKKGVEQSWADNRRSR